MKFVISGKNLEVSEGLRTAVEEKLGKLGRYFTPDTKCVVGNIIRSEQVSNDMYVSIDLVEEVIERQLKKYKKKIIDKHQNSENFQKAFIEKDYDSFEDDLPIIRTKKFEIKPMYPEDACVQMELLGHAFYVFVNAETDQTSVVYRRKDGTYGMIEPDV